MLPLPYTIPLNIYHATVTLFHRVSILAISPADINYNETLRTLRYAVGAKNVVNKPTKNEVTILFCYILSLNIKNNCVIMNAWILQYSALCEYKKNEQTKKKAKQKNKAKQNPIIQ